MHWSATTLADNPSSLLPFGNGKSYGDSCHNDPGTLIDNRNNAEILAFDAESGTIRCKTGIMLSHILQHIIPHGWFLPVTPGTQMVTLGGAIANDVHGKNHHRTGTFGNHVLQFELHRSDGEPQICSHEQNNALFAATIGGMGLTGNIDWAEISLMKISSVDIDQQTIKFGRLEDFFNLNQAADRDHEYSVAWIDSMARGTRLGRGLLLNGNHAENGNFEWVKPKSRVTVPFTPPFALVTGLALKAFNEAYYHKQRRTEVHGRVAYGSYFYPLDSIGHWNRLYGPRGLFQHQCIIPPENAEQVIAHLLEACHVAGQGSFLTVLKRFGDIPSPGLMSFPREGFTLTLDFPNLGQRTLNLLEQLDQITLKSGGAINPYKDARMSAATYQCSFPQWPELEAARDPKFMSDFWRRTTGS